MSDQSTELLQTVRKIHDLLELLAEDKIAQRDAKQRAELREIVGSGVIKQNSVLLMDGTRSQSEIVRETSGNQGNLSTLVGRLHKAKLLADDTKKPKLVISIPSSFFESDAKTR